MKRHGSVFNGQSHEVEVSATEGGLFTKNVIANPAHVPCKFTWLASKTYRIDFIKRRTAFRN